MKINLNGSEKNRHTRFLEILDLKPQKFWIYELRIQHNVIRAWKLGTFPKLKYLLKVCEIIGVNTNWLFWGIGPMLMEDLDNKYREELIENETELLNLQLDQKDNQLDLQAIAFEKRFQELDNEINILKQTLKNRDSVKYLYDLFDQDISKSSIDDFPAVAKTLLNPFFIFFERNAEEISQAIFEYLTSENGKGTILHLVKWINERK